MAPTLGLANARRGMFADPSMIWPSDRGMDASIVTESSTGPLHGDNDTLSICAIATALDRSSMKGHGSA